MRRTVCSHDRFSLIEGSMATQRDYYEALGVDEDATPQVIKVAYRKLAFHYHPDRNTEDVGAVERMKEINEAYAVLSDPQKRSRYDGLRKRYGSYASDRFRQSYSEQDIFKGSDINQIFEEMAKSFGFRGFEDVFRESYGQGYKSFTFGRPGMFGRVIIFGAGRRIRNEGSEAAPQPGILSRAVGRLARYAMGRMLRNLAANGDAYDTIVLEGEQADKGGKVTYVDSRRSRELLISVPAGVREGQMIRLKGMADSKEGGGDLYLTVQIKRPVIQKIRKFLKI